MPRSEWENNCSSLQFLQGYGATLPCEGDTTKTKSARGGKTYSSSVPSIPNGAIGGPDCHTTIIIPCTLHNPFSRKAVTRHARQTLRLIWEAPSLHSLQPPLTQSPSHDDGQTRHGRGRRGWRASMGSNQVSHMFGEFLLSYLPCINSVG